MILKFSFFGWDWYFLENLEDFFCFMFVFVFVYDVFDVISFIDMVMRVGYFF